MTVSGILLPPALHAQSAASVVPSVTLIRMVEAEDQWRFDATAFAWWLGDARPAGAAAPRSPPDASAIRHRPRHWSRD